EGAMWTRGDTKAGLSAARAPVTPKANVNASPSPPAAAVPTDVAKPIAPATSAQPKANIGAPIVAPGLSPGQSSPGQNTSQSPGQNSNQSSSPVPVSSPPAAQPPP